jgi:peptidoglycan/LPS O-acetylase OafA/YrhL
MVEMIVIFGVCFMVGAVPNLLAWKLASRRIAIALGLAWLACMVLAFFLVPADPHPYFQVLSVPMLFGWFMSAFFAWFWTGWKSSGLSRKSE